MSDQRPQSRIRVLMFTDIVGSTDLKRRLGDAVVADLIRQHDVLFRNTLHAFPYAEVLKDVGDGFLAAFNSASDAVFAALHFQSSLGSQEWNQGRIRARVGVHLGEVSELDIEPTSGTAKLSGLAVDITARVMSLCLPGQILMTRSAFDNARQFIRETSTSDGGTETVTRKWIAHGRYLFKGAEEPLEVFEVGEIGVAPFQFPPDTEKARRSVAADEEETLGWRPAVGLEIPDRKGWMLERRLGEGGFGEVWLGEYAKTHTRRVFKFCFDAERLRSFKREIVLFRLLRNALGDRSDIAKLHEVQVEHPPYYIESEFTEHGSIVEWAETQGGIDKVPLATRLDLVIRTAQAVAAAHSVGVLHKDIKPSNILIYRGENGNPMPRLTDFGIGELTDPSKLANFSATMLGVTAALVTKNDSSRTGTRLYAPPETLIGKPFTIQGDVYALGIVLYQMVVGDLDRPMAQGWERDVADPLLREDIARCVEGQENDRLSSAKELAERLLSLNTRRRARQRRRIARVSMAASAMLLVLLSLSAVWIWREHALRLQTQQENQKFKSINEFLQHMLTAVNARDAEGPEVKVVDKLDQAIVQLDAGEISEEPDVEAGLRGAIGNAYRALNLFPAAEKQLTVALETQRKIHPEPNLEVAQYLEDLGAVKWANSQYPDAEKLFRESLDMRRAVSGDESLPTASSLNYLAATLDRENKHDDAESMYRKALEIRRKLATGPDRILVARSLNNLGTCLLSQKKYGEAEDDFREATQIVREMRGNDHIDVGGGLSNLAKCFVGEKRFDDAEKAYLDALQIKRNKLGEANTYVADTEQGLADLYAMKNDWPKSQEFSALALDTRLKLLRPGHPSILWSRQVLSAAMMEQRKFAEAIPILRAALEQPVKEGSADEAKIADVKSRLGECLMEAGDVAGAEPLLKEGYKEIQKIGNPSDNMDRATQRLIALYERTNRPQDAESLRSQLAADHN
ncbi:MAG TPA: tetratricopeptide repeat protein [Phycisphaerales bacterium]|nr:tetratricopeptide repeat protein [Phycisphaerales bacterium]